MNTYHRKTFFPEAGATFIRSLPIHYRAELKSWLLLDGILDLAESLIVYLSIFSIAVAWEFIFQDFQLLATKNVLPNFKLIAVQWSGCIEVTEPTNSRIHDEAHLLRILLHLIELEIKK